MIPTRAVVGVMVFTACFFAYVIRVNMSLNIIAMVEPRGLKNGNKQADVAECLKQGSEENVTGTEKNISSTSNFGERYDWDSEVQALILGSYFWGYILTSVPGGLLAEKFGSLRTVGIGTILSAVLNILIPLAASYHYALVITLRFLIGALCGVVYPSLHCLISRWAPPEEKGKFAGALLGGTLGTVVTWTVLGIVIEQLGWHWAFILPGIVTLLWCGLWFVLVADTPNFHPRISKQEKTYIASCLGDNVNDKIKEMPPYREIFLSIPFWMYVILYFGNEWALYLLITTGPRYMTEVLGFNLGHSGVLASLPHLARILVGFLFAFIGDFMRNKNWLTVTATRKIFVVFSHLLPGLFMFLQTLIGCHALLAVALMTMSLGMNGASILTNLQNPQDLAPNFAGTLYGLASCIGCTTGFLTPLLTDYITKDNMRLARKYRPIVHSNSSFLPRLWSKISPFPFYTYTSICIVIITTIRKWINTKKKLFVIPSVCTVTTVQVLILLFGDHCLKALSLCLTNGYDNNGLNEWQKIFWIGASVYIGSGIIFCLFGSGKQQKWNFTNSKKEGSGGTENPAFNSTEEVTRL